jgi:hypothetical protein
MRPSNLLKGLPGYQVVETQLYAERFDELAPDVAKAESVLPALAERDP